MDVSQSTGGVHNALATRLIWFVVKESKGFAVLPLVRRSRGRLMDLANSDIVPMLRKVRSRG